LRNTISGQQTHQWKTLQNFQRKWCKYGRGFKVIIFGQIDDQVPTALSLIPTKLEKEAKAKLNMEMKSR
jgi:hypothetical protein